MRRIGFVLSALLSTASWSLIGCDSGRSVEPQETSTWDTIQHDIFASNCVSCHSVGTSFARQSGLVLTPDLAYSQLINSVPRNAAAAQDGLVLLSNEGLAGLFKSYLWEKINAPDQDHFYADHPNYGAQMPLGRPPLTNGQLEFIRQWIRAGAPEKGVVADLALLQDEERYAIPKFESLEPPLAGIQLRLGPFEVAPQYEREVYFYQALDHAEDIFVNRFELSMRSGSHHFIINQFPDYTPADVIPEPETYRDLRDAAGNYQDSEGYDLFDWRVMQYQVPIVIAQSTRLDFSLPPGVAMRLPAGTGLDMNSHYANTADQVMIGEVLVNLHLADPAKVERVAEVFALSNFDIDLPAGEVTSLEKEFIFKEDRHIFQLVSHTHDRMEEFTAEFIGGPRDGELIYISYDWEHPAPLRFDPPLMVEEGQGFRIRATYDNDTERNLNFGFTRADEMMILYGYYYAD
ncbi:MAG: hypothetical protein F4Y91_04450 [Gemmatimonadetes bacterium]|nr:hypothetical protein [Gemmatimonadota bacterium]MYB69086.1 hypothetical protein [Gemmatimonadota bacterium]